MPSHFSLPQIDKESKLKNIINLFTQCFYIVLFTQNLDLCLCFCWLTLVKGLVLKKKKKEVIAHIIRRLILSTSKILYQY